VDEFNAIAFSEVAQKQVWLKSRGHHLTSEDFPGLSFAFHRPAALINFSAQQNTHFINHGTTAGSISASAHW
jgi:hypothetical protein